MKCLGKSVGRTLCAGLAFSLLMTSSNISLAANYLPITPEAIQVAAPPYKFERSTKMSDSQFLDHVAAHMAESPEKSAEIAERAASLRPHLKREIAAVAENVVASPASEAASGAAAATDGAAGAATGAAMSTTAAVVGGLGAIAAAGVAVAAGGDSGGGSKKKDPGTPKPPEKPKDPKDPETPPSDPKDPEDPQDPRKPKDPIETPDIPPKDFETSEYHNMGALGPIKASHAYAQGFTGEGVIVGVIDTGVDINHPELAGAIVNPWNPITESSNVTDHDGHGTHVAGIIGARKDDNGMHGVAYNAKIVPIALGSENSTLEVGGNGEYMGRGIQHAIDAGAKIINNSYSIELGIEKKDITVELFDARLPEVSAAFQRVIDEDVIMVFANGNEGDASASLPASAPIINPDWADHWIAVGMLDKDGSRHPQSNACGDAADWCLFAPGWGVNSTLPDGDYGIMGGTSMAAPVVAGGAALLREAFPYMTAPEITSLLFETADKIGPKEIYGHGAMNLERAFQPVGPVAVPVGDSIEGRKLSLSGSSLHVSAAFGDGIGKALSGHSLVALDKYNRGFRFDMGNFVTPASHHTRKDALHRLKLFGGIEERSINTIETGPFSITTATRLRASDPGLGHSPYSRMSFGFTSGSTSVEASMNPDMGRSFGFREMGFGNAPMMDGKSFDQPHLALMETGFGTSMGFGLTENSSFQVAAFSGNVAAEDRDVFTNAPSMFGGVGQLTTQFSDSLTVRAAAGAVSEEGSLLGSVSRGAFGENMKSNTFFVNLGTTVDVAPRTKLTFAGSLGQSSFKQNAGLVRSGKGIVTSSFGVGVSHRDLFRDGDMVTLAAAQPLRVESGRVNLSVPTSRNMDGSIGYTRLSLNPQPSGREISLQGSYGFRILDGIDTSIGAMHRFDANHINGAQETIGMLSATFKF